MAFRTRVLILFGFLFLNSAAMSQVSDKLASILADIEIANLLSDEAFDEGDYEKSFELLAAVDKQIKLFVGRESALYATNSIIQARCLYYLGDRNKSLEYLKRTDLYLEKNKKNRTIQHRDLLISIASLYSELGKASAASDIYTNAAYISKYISGAKDSIYLEVINQSAIINFNSGRHTDAERQLREVIRDIPKSSSENVQYADLYSNYAQICHQLNNYDRALNYYLKTLSINAKKYGTNNGKYRNILIQLKGLLVGENLSWGAELMVFALVSDEFKPEQIELIADLNKQLESNINLALSGKTEEALKSNLEAYHTVSGIWSNSKMDGVILYNQGLIYFLDNNYQKAEEKLKCALSYYAACLGERTDEYHEVSMKLAEVYIKTGLIEEAEHLYLKSEYYLRSKFGEDKHRYFHKLIQIADFFDGIGKYNEAAVLYESLISSSKDLYGESSKSFSYVLEKFGKSANYSGYYQKSESALEAALSQCIEIYGPLGSECISSMLSLAHLYADLDKYEKCIELTDMIEHLISEAELEDSNDYLSLLIIKASARKSQNNLCEAERLYNKFAEIVERKSGKNSEDYALAINDLANIYLSRGEFERAKEYYMESARIRKEVLGDRHPDYLISLNNLAILYRNMNEFDTSEKYFVEAMEKRREIMGENSIDYIRSVNGLAGLYGDMLQYSKAEKYADKAIDLMRSIGKINNPDLIEMLGLLGNTYHEIERYDKAELILLEAMDSTLNLVGKSHFKYMDYSLDLSEMYYDLGNMDKAVEFATKCMESFNKYDSSYGEIAVKLSTVSGIILTKLGRFDEALECYARVINVADTSQFNSILFGKLFFNLGITSEKIDSFEYAKMSFVKSWEIMEKTIGRNHPYTLNILRNAVNTMFKTESDHDYYNLYDHILQTCDSVIGQNNKLYISTLRDLINYLEFNGDYDLSDSLIGEMLRINQVLRTSAVSYMSDVEQEMYSVVVDNASNHIINWMVNRKSEGVPGGELPIHLYNSLLFEKGFILEAAQEMRLLENSYPETRAFRDTLINYSKQIARLNLSQSSNPEALQYAIDRYNLFQKKISNKITGYADLSRSVTYTDIARSLKDDEIAIEFVLSDGINHEDSTSQYYAILMKKQFTRPIFISICSSKLIDSVLVATKTNNNSFNLYTSRGIKRSVSISLPDLYAYIWKPLEKWLKGVNKIYYAPSGSLHRVNFEAIPLGGNNIVGNVFEMVRLGSTRSLVISRNKVVNTNNNAILFGDIQYNIDTTELNQTAKFENTTESIDGVKSDTEWERLVATLEEITEIESLMKSNGFDVRVYKNNNATEAVFKDIDKSNPSPRIIHLATHGFFYSKNEKIQEINNQDISSGALPVFVDNKDPMFRSGVLLYGSNYFWKYGKVIQTDGEDGLLMAYEISQMDLSGTELVVLSACETALGDIKGHEGVFGLQRAFKIAGVRYLIVSLWEVPDVPTSRFMNEFYQNLMIKKMSVPDSFRTAQNAMRQIYKDPLDWAGFILIE